MRKFYQKIVRLYHLRVFRLCIFLCLISASVSTQAQCPVNLDYELGNFTNWECWSQSPFNGVFNFGVPIPPQPGRHVMYTFPPSAGRDYYGNFPINCPNGSGHSVRIGNTITGQTADKVSYIFTIPAGQNTYNLIYHYALVLNDAANTSHPPNLQPRFILEVKNLTDGTPLPCPLPPIVVNGGLPGFFDSPNPNPNNGTVVRCKPWAAASINLDNNAGKTIEVSFTATGCGLNGGSHFGYAYIDVNSECSSSFSGATYCPDDTAIDILAPYGYEFYEWYNASGVPLGNTQSLHLSPPPPSGSIINVIVVPYANYGCRDTLTAELWDTLTIQPYAGRDTMICPGNPVQLGGLPKPGLIYSWSPPAGLSDPTISNPLASPAITTQYILSVTNGGGGCLTKDTVNISVSALSDSLQLIGSANYCTASGLTSVLKVFPADSIQWYRNGVAIPGATSTTYTVTQSGLYHAVLFSFVGNGCLLSTRQQQIDIWESPVAGFATNVANQCFAGNQFVFTNTSTITTGMLTYNWDLGDGIFSNMTDVIHNYLAPGTYTVKLVVTAPGGCADSVVQVVTVYASPVVDFTVNTANQCYKNNSFVFTNSSTISSGTLQYTWDRGDGSPPITTRDITYSYLTTGTYQVVLRSSDAAGICFDTKQMLVTVYPSPVAGFTTNTTIQCLPGNLFAFTNTSTISSGTMQFNWDFGDGITSTLTNINHSYNQPGTYTVKLSAESGAGTCTDVYTMVVRVDPVAYPSFHVTPVCTDMRVPIINLTRDVPGTTVNYLWDFGNGITSTTRTPIYSYPAAGTYTLSLTVNTTQCPAPILVSSQVIKIDAPTPGIRLPDVNAISYFSEALHARPIGNSIMWTPATSLSNRFGYHPYFNGPSDQLYTIKMKTVVGCETVDTLYVKVRKNIKIYVPKAFTPGGDGKNDRLKPFLMSFVKLNYFRVFNRWGKQLFEMRGDGPGWDGLVNGNPTEPQTVVWMMEAVDVDGIVHKEQGTTILLR